jgi:hypothetical protein
MAQLGPEKRLSCIRYMGALAHLELSASLLFESPDAMWRGDICDALPPSLERLHLQEKLASWEPWPGVVGAVLDDLPVASQRYQDDCFRNRDQYPILLRRALLQLAFHSSDRLPKLKTVRLTLPPLKDDWTNTWGPELVAISSSTSSWGKRTLTFAPERSSPSV